MVDTPATPKNDKPEDAAATAKRVADEKAAADTRAVEEERRRVAAKKTVEKEEAEKAKAEADAAAGTTEQRSGFLSTIWSFLRNWLPGNWGSSVDDEKIKKLADTSMSKRLFAAISPYMDVITSFFSDEPSENPDTRNAGNTATQPPADKDQKETRKPDDTIARAGDRAAGPTQDSQDAGSDDEKSEGPKEETKTGLNNPFRDNLPPNGVLLNRFGNSAGEAVAPDSVTARAELPQDDTGGLDPVSQAAARVNASIKIPAA